MNKTIPEAQAPSTPLPDSPLHKNEVIIYRRMQRSPLVFIRMMWRLIPQPFKDERSKIIALQTPLSDWKGEWFGGFKEGLHLTWQQYVILLSIERAIKGQGRKRISIRSGHGVGKSSVLAMIILWYLYCHKNANIACTAPSNDQLHGALWKEVFLWQSMMPEEEGALYELTDDFVRMKESPKFWFARARTARDDKPEALSGVHGPHIMLICDEASGITNEKIFECLEGSLTGKDIFVILISNPTRLSGYFYDSHHRDKGAWQTLGFNSEESPIVSDGYKERILEKYGNESDEYRVRVQGLFPREDAVDKSGYTPLILEGDIKMIHDPNYAFRKPKMGIDPAGEGRDKAVWVIRDRFRAKKILEEKVSTGEKISMRTVGLMEHYNIEPQDVFVDAFGIGGKAVQFLERMGKQINAVEVGEPALEKKEFANKKAENYDRMKKWMRSGGEFLGNASEWEDLKSLKKIRNKRDQIEMKTKEQMRKDHEPSPNTAEALMLTFEEDDESEIAEEQINRRKNIAQRSLSDLSG